MDSYVPVGPSPSISDAVDSVRRWLDDRGGNYRLDPF